MDLSEYIGEEVTGYVSSPAHSARLIAATIQERTGTLPKSIHSSRGYSFRVVLADRRKVLARLSFLDGAQPAITFTAD